MADPETLRLPYASWVPEVTPGLAAVLWILWLVSGVYFLLGRAKPAAGLVLAVCLGGALALDRQWYSNHLYLLAMLVPLVALADAGGGRARLLPVRLVQALVVLVYTFSGLAKLNPEFLSGAVLRQYLAPLALPAEVVVAGGWAVIAVELSLGPLLLAARTRRGGRLLGVALHAGMVLTRSFDVGIAMFGVAMVGTYPLFGGQPARPTPVGEDPPRSPPPCGSPPVEGTREGPASPPRSTRSARASDHSEKRPST